MSCLCRTLRVWPSQSTSIIRNTRSAILDRLFWESSGEYDLLAFYGQAMFWSKDWIFLSWNWQQHLYFTTDNSNIWISHCLDIQIFVNADSLSRYCLYRMLLCLRNARWLLMFIYTNMCKTFNIAWIPVKAKGHRQRHLRHYLCSQLTRAEVLLNYLIIYYYFQSLLSFSKFSVVGSLNLKCELLVS